MLQVGSLRSGKGRAQFDGLHRSLPEAEGDKKLSHSTESIPCAVVIILGWARFRSSGTRLGEHGGPYCRLSQQRSAGVTSALSAWVWERVRERVVREQMLDHAEFRGAVLGGGCAERVPHQVPGVTRQFRSQVGEPVPFVTQALPGFVC